MHCATVNRHLGLSAERKGSQKEDNGKPMMCALYIPRYAKRHVVEQIDIEQ